MKNTIEVSGLKVSFDIDNIRKVIENKKWNDEDYTAYGECGGVNEDGIREEYCVSEEEFNKMKLETLNFIDKLNENTIPNLVENSVKITAKGTVNKNSRNLVYDMGDINGYDDYYGSHSYQTTAIIFNRTGDTSVELIVDEWFNHKDSF